MYLKNTCREKCWKIKILRKVLIESFLLVFKVLPDSQST